MSDPTDTDRLRELDAAATPGPWHRCDWHAQMDDEEGDGVGGPDHQPVAFLYAEMYEPDAGEPTTKDDAELIAAMRNALPGLLDRLNAAQAQVAACWDLLDDPIPSDKMPQARLVPKGRHWVDAKLIRAALETTPPAPSGEADAGGVHNA